MGNKIAKKDFTFSKSSFERLRWTHGITGGRVIIWPNLRKQSDIIFMFHPYKTLKMSKVKITILQT